MSAKFIGDPALSWPSAKPRVIDKTGLTGKYDLTLRFSCGNYQFGAASGMLSGPPNRRDAPDGIPNTFVARRGEVIEALPERLSNQSPQYSHQIVDGPLLHPSRRFRIMRWNSARVVFAGIVASI
jgi:hypothetical protein